MSTVRQDIARTITSRAQKTSEHSGQRELVTNSFGEKVFNDSVMREALPKNVYKALKKTIQEKASLDPSLANIVAQAMKDWAIEHGATHYTHWFQPLTGSTAEKHDSFIEPQADGKIILEFSGKTLVKGEPDASSFPNGGIRDTFEARGYTAWDPTSPAFIRETPLGGTLCIPTVFVSYTGEALDKKTPLLRSEEALSKAATRLIKVLGDETVTKVHANSGLEQEYFLIDIEYYNQRPDLVATGRTLFGAAPYKGQSLDDHYFGSIKRRVLSCMQDMEKELYKLGVPVKTRHNEVAPSQFELAPVFQATNLATDQNLLTMELIEEVAAKHNLKALFHEKPFAGLNGSGKHCNFSMTDSNGHNLLEPGNTPHDNLQFVTFLAAIIRAIDSYAKLLRFSVASAGNDHRLGANEAPPAILSVFLGEELDDIVSSIVAGKDPVSKEKTHMMLGAATLPALPKDTTDRNRTSPFAFTGNKFEFRALGSAQNPSVPNMILNTIVADSVTEIANEIEAKINAGSSVEEATNAVIKDNLTKYKRVIFNGDGYSEEWPIEAEKRGLANLKTTVESTQAFMDEDSIALFERHNVLNKSEIEARYNVKIEKYILLLDIEIRATIDIAKTIILPIAMKYAEQLASSALAIKEVTGSISDTQKGLIANVSAKADDLVNAIAKLEETFAVTHKDELTHAQYYRDIAISAMNAVREAVDTLEVIVEDDLWTLPKYREILFLS